MRFEDIRVSRKLWGSFLVFAMAVLLLAGLQKLRLDRATQQSFDSIVTIVTIDDRIAVAVGWKGITQTAITMVMGSAITSDSHLAEQYDAKVKAMILDVNKLQESIMASADTAPQKAALEKMQAARKLVLGAIAQATEIKRSGDITAAQAFAQAQLQPLVRDYHLAQDAYIAELRTERSRALADVKAHSVQVAVEGLVTW